MLTAGLCAGAGVAQEPAGGRLTGAELRAARLARLEVQRRQASGPRDPADGGGRAWLQGGGTPVAAASNGSWAIYFETGPVGIAEGGGVRFYVPTAWRWSPPQLTDPAAPGYVRVTAYAEGVQLEVARNPQQQYVQVRIRGRRLEPGERLLFHYGAGPAGAQADRFAERGSPFWLEVDGDGDGYFGLLADSPRVDVVAGTPARLELTVPSTGQVGQPLRLTAAVLDEFGNAGAPVTGEVRLQPVPGLELPVTLPLAAADAGRITVSFRALAPGLYRLRASGPGELVAESPPLLVAADAPAVLWGDVQGHSGRSDGTGTPEDFFLYARDVAALDVVSLTDHDHWGRPYLDQNPAAWREIIEQTQRFHQPGRFVTLLGFEWTSWVYGHRHVLYFSEAGNEPLLSNLNPRTENPPGLWQALAGQQVLTVAHHTAGGPIELDWDFVPDAQLETVVEIASVHGSSEALDSPRAIYNPVPGHFARDALDRGYRLGFIGSGDSHDGHPGLSHIASPSGGLAAFLTADLSRAGIYEALRNRRTYATNGPRILLLARLKSAGGKLHPMGAAVPAGPLTLEVEVFAPGALERLDLIRSGQVVHTFPAAGRREVTLEHPLPDLKAGEYVYVRVVQEDGGLAWCSPFFIE